MEDTIIYAYVANLMIGRKLERLKKLKITLDKQTNVRYNDISGYFALCKIITKTEYWCQHIHICGLLSANATVS